MALTFAALPAPASNSSGAAVDVSAMAGAKTLQVTALAGAMVLIEVSNDDAAAIWSPLVQLTKNGSQEVVVAARWMRATTLNYQGGGAPTVNVGAEASSAAFAALVPPTGNGNGDGVDVSALPPYKSVQVSGTFRGAVNLEVSNDGGATYAQADGFSFQSGGGLKSAVVAAEFMRVSRSGIAAGATPGTPVVDIGGVEIDVSGGGGGATADGTTITGDGTAEDPLTATGDLPQLDVAGAAHFTGNAVFDATTTIYLTKIIGYFALNSSVSPAALAAGDTNNYSIPGIAGANRIRQATNAANSALTGIEAFGIAGAMFQLVNLGPGTLTLKHENAGSDAGNRFALEGGADRVIGANGAVFITYDTTLLRWLVVG